MFLIDPDDNGEQRKARFVKITGNWENYNKEVEKRHQMLKDLEFCIVYDRPSHLKKDGGTYNFDRGNPDEQDSAFDDILKYNEVIRYLNKEVTNEDGEYWAFQKILGIQHTPPGHRDRRGSEYNVQMLWETGEVTFEPLDFLAKDIPVGLAQYAIENSLLNKPGWRRLQSYKRRQKQVERLIRQAKLRSYRLRTKYKYRFEVPRNYKHAMELDKRNGNTLWSDANTLEHEKLRKYDVFIDKGQYHVSKVPQGYQKISVHTVFDVKHDRRHRARVVADGHLTDVPTESVYSGVVSL